METIWRTFQERAKSELANCSSLKWRDEHFKNELEMQPLQQLKNNLIWQGQLSPSQTLAIWQLKYNKSLKVSPNCLNLKQFQGLGVCAADRPKGKRQKVSKVLTNSL
jgi:hypothetical protein